MRIVEIRPGHDAEDRANGQAVLRQEIDNPSMSVMIVRGSSPEVGLFVDRASARCDPFPWRGGVWVRDAKIFPQGAEETWFAGQADACAVILDLQDRPAEWLDTASGLFDIERAWLRAEGR